MFRWVHYKTVYILIALGFIFSLPFHPYPGSFIPKVLPALILALLMFKYLPGTNGKIMGLGFIFSAGGDLFLDLDRQAYFVYGLGSFLIAHLLYIAVFTRTAQWSPKRLFAALPVFFYIGGMAFYLTPHLGKLTVPVLLYITCIGLMGISAAFVPLPLPTVFAGACLFMFSDSLIALNKFIAPIPAAPYWILLTYYSAQFKIATGLLAPYEPNLAPRPSDKQLQPLEQNGGHHK